MVCACTNYFRAGSEKGQFRKKLFFTVNQTRMFHSLKEWAQSVPNSKLLLLCNDHLWFLEIWWTESTENNTCWGSFFLHNFSHLLIFACDIVTAEQMWPISALLTVLYLALTVVLRRECLQKQAVLLLTACIAWKLLASWQTGFCGFSRSDIGCYRPPVIYSCGGKL